MNTSLCKSFFLLFTGVLSGSSLSAQTLNTVFPQAGDTLLYREVELISAIDYNATGTGLTWDFSASSNAAPLDTLLFDVPGAFSLSFSYPGADLGLNSRGHAGGVLFGMKDIFFLDQTGGVTSLVGTASVTGTALDNFAAITVDPLEWFHLPAQLYTSFADTGISEGYTNGPLVGLPFDSIHFISSIYRYDTIDAQGTVLLTNRSFPDVLRRKTTDITIDSLYSYDINNNMWVFIDSRERLTIYYSWLGDSTDFIIAQATEVDNIITSVISLPQDDLVLSIDSLYRGPQFSIFPNPSTGVFNISIHNGAEQAGVAEVSDVSGKVMYAKRFQFNGQGYQQVSLDLLRELPAGIYTCKMIFFNSLIRVEKIVIVK